MPRCFLAKKSSSSSTSSSLASSCAISSEIEEGNNHLDDHLTPLTEKWDDTITVKSEIETEDEEGISSDGNCSNNSGEDHFVPPSRLIHRSTVGSISAAKAVQSIKEPIAVVTPCSENYESNNEKIIPSNINNKDEAQSCVPESPDAKKKQSTPPLTSNTSCTIATQTYNNPEDEEDEEDIKPSRAILNRKQKATGTDAFRKTDGGNLTENLIQGHNVAHKRCYASNQSEYDDLNTNSNALVHSIESKDFNGNDEKTKISYLEQKERLEKNLLNQTLKFCSRKHSKKHQKRKKKLLNSKVAALGLDLTTDNGLNAANTESNNTTVCLGKSFQHPIKLNKSFATLTVMHHGMQQQTVSSNSQQHSPLQVGPFPVKAVSTIPSNNFKLLPQQPVSMVASTSVFPISTPSSKAITELNFPATAVTAGGATIHPISAVTPSTNDCKDAPKLPSTLNHQNADCKGQTSCLPQGRCI